MLIAGASGHSKEVLDLVLDINDAEKIVFFDDICDENLMIYNKFKVLKTIKEVKNHFINSNEFILGLGNPKLRKLLTSKLEDIGGDLTSAISPFSKISRFTSTISEGVVIFHNCTIGPEVEIGKGCLIYHNTQITHDCKIGDFCELSPNTILLGNSVIGNYTQLGAGSIILPNVRVGSNVVIGAGSVVTKDIPSNSLAYGTPAIVKQKNS